MVYALEKDEWMNCLSREIKSKSVVEEKFVLFGIKFKKEGKLRKLRKIR